MRLTEGALSFVEFEDQHDGTWEVVVKDGWAGKVSISWLSVGFLCERLLTPLTAG
jgi:hypothetical protein